MKKSSSMILTSLFCSVWLLVLSGCGGTSTAKTPDAQIPIVQVFKLGPTSPLGFNGKIAANETVRIHSKITGRIAAILVQEGSIVKKGDVLAQLETHDLMEQLHQAQAGLDEAKARLAEAMAGAREQDIQAAQSAVRLAQASVDQAKAAYDFAQKTYNQARNRYDMGLLAKEELEKIELEYEKAKAGYEQSKAQLASAQSKLNLLKAGATPHSIEALKAGVARAQAAVEMAENNIREATIVSPIDGIVVKTNVHPGEMAFANLPTGTALFTLVDMDPVHVELSVPENLIHQIQEGSKAEVTVPGLQGKIFQGTVSFVSPVTDENSNTFPVKITIDNPEGKLHAGVVAEVRFSNHPSSRLELPKDALIVKGQKTYVYKVEHEIIHQIPVDTEEKNENWVFVKGDAPLKPGDTIVINPADTLSDGMLVHVN